jgi:hypothetical protein
MRSLLETVMHHLDVQVQIPWGDVDALHICIVYRRLAWGHGYGCPLHEMEDGKGRVKFIHDKGILSFTEVLYALTLID